MLNASPINGSLPRAFLTANWEYLAMINYEVDPAILKKHVPTVTEIDLFEGKALVSVVGFLFKNTKVFGLRWPWHINFEEVNLRYYVRRFDGTAWRRGVGFVSEIVPKVCISEMANRLYNEHYSTAKMWHTIDESPAEISASYHWKKRGAAVNHIKIIAENRLTDILSGSEAEFILEHYFGYNQLNARTVIEYGVEHPRWQVYPVTEFELDCDVAGLYGADFEPFIKDIKPHSVFLAKGSEVTVRKPVYLREKKV